MYTGTETGQTVNLSPLARVGSTPSILTIWGCSSNWENICLAHKGLRVRLPPVPLKSTPSLPAIDGQVLSYEFAVSGWTATPLVLVRLQCGTYGVFSVMVSTSDCGSENISSILIKRPLFL